MTNFHFLVTDYQERDVLQAIPCICGLRHPQAYRPVRIISENGNISSRRHLLIQDRDFQYEHWHSAESSTVLARFERVIPRRSFSRSSGFALLATFMRSVPCRPVSGSAGDAFLPISRSRVAGRTLSLLLRQFTKHELESKGYVTESARGEAWAFATNCRRRNWCRDVERSMNLDQGFVDSRYL